MHLNPSATSVRVAPIISRFWWVYLLFSFVVIGISLASLWKNGLPLGVDFKGGTEYEIKVAPEQGVKIDSNFLMEKISLATPTDRVEEVATNHFVIHLRSESEEEKKKIEETLAEAKLSVEEVSYTQVGAVIGQELIRKTLVAIGLSLAFIVVFIATRFQSPMFGLSALLAILHDAVIVIGLYSLAGKFFGAPVDVLFVTAMLTILSFSVHDTVVVYDRIREKLKTRSRDTFAEVLDQSVLDTLVRSLRNSLTILFMLASLLLLGPLSLRWFAFALLLGTVIGTYSSTFTAVPLLLLLKRLPSFSVQKK